MIMLRLLFSVSAIALFSLACSSLIDGGSSVSGNGRISGKVYAAAGQPASKTLVRAFPADYDPVRGPSLPLSLVDTTDESGGYELSRVPSGRYVVQAVSMDDGTKLCVDGVMVSQDQVTSVPGATLRSPGVVVVSSPAEFDVIHGYIYIPGSEIFAYTKGSAGFVTLDSVPAGAIPAIVYSATNTQGFTVLRYNVGVVPGDTVAVMNTSWLYSRPIHLNTTATGADVQENQYDFPVLIRLSEENFNFSEARTDGGDLRFAKVDDTPLPYEIERWDYGARQAEVWVKVDTVFGNNDNQFIEMYWGNGQAEDASNSAAVFDTDNGFRGVWHMDERYGNLFDATQNALTGKRSGNQAVTAGAVGYGQAFRDSGDYSDMGDVLDPGLSSFTVSAWVQRSSIDMIQTIIAKSNGDVPSSTYGWLLAFDTTNHVDIFMASGGTGWGNTGTFAFSTKSTITDSDWHFITVVVNRSANDSCRLYIDGVDLSSNRVGDVTGVGPVENADGLRIGSEADGGYQLRGSADECSISTVIRSPGWVQLCFMNQRSDDRLVVWK